MTKRNKLQHSQARDQAIDRYMQALDRGDIDTVEVILSQAAYDPELDRLLHEVNTALYVEDGLDIFVTNAEQVRSLARQHLQSAFVDEAEVEAMIDRPLTVGDVIARLQANRQIALPDQEASRQLLGSGVELPNELTTRTISELARRLGVAASEQFWRVFREAAIMLGLGHSQAQAHLAAAREQRRRYKVPQRQSTGQQTDNEYEATGK
jgi:transposase-like protein